VIVTFMQATKRHKISSFELQFDANPLKQLMGWAEYRGNALISNYWTTLGGYSNPSSDPAQ